MAITTVTKAANAHTAVSTGWTTPTNAYSTTGDNVYTTAVSVKNGDVSGDFGLANITSADIPDAAGIVAVRCIVEWKMSASVTGGLLGCQGRVSGANSGSEATQSSIAEAQSTATFGTVTLANIRAAATDIKVRIRCTKGSTNTAMTGSVDFVKFEIDWVPNTFRTATDTGMSFSDSLSVAVGHSYARAVRDMGVTGSANYLTDVTTAIMNFGNTGATQKLAMPIVFPRSGSIRLSETDVGKIGSVADNLIVRLFDDSSGLPGTTVIGTAVSGFPGGSLPGGGATSRLGVSSSSLYTVTGGVTYWLVYERSGAQDAANYFVTRVNPNTKTGGIWAYNGSVWSSFNTDYDCSTCQYMYEDTIGVAVRAPVYITLADNGLSPVLFSYYSQIGGGLGSGNTQLGSEAFAGACDASAVWIADSSNKRVIKRDRSSLAYITKLDISGAASPRGICSDGTYIYSVDSDIFSGGGAGRIQKYDIATLTLQVSVVSAGFGAASPNTLSFPFSCATDGTYLWVGDNGNHRVLKLNCSDLQYVSQIGLGTNGTGDNQLGSPVGLTIDSTHMYVLEDANSRVNKRLLSTGAYVAKYGSAGTGNDNISATQEPNVQVATDGSDRLYVLDLGNDRVVVRKASDLTYVDQFGSTGSGDTQFDRPSGAAIHDGFIDIVDSGVNGRIVRWLVGTGLPFDSLVAAKSKGRSATDQGVVQELHFFSNLGTSGSGDDNLNGPYGMCADGTHLYIMDSLNNRLMKRLLSTLTYVAQIGTNGTGNDQFTNPTDICTDGTHLYISDFSNDRIKKHLASTLAYVSKIGSTGTGDSNFDAPRGMATDGTHLYIADSVNNRIKKHLCSDLSYVTSIGTAGSGNDQFNNPCAIAYDSGYIYIADGQNNRIHKRLASDLSFVAMYGSTGTGNDQYQRPQGLSILNGFIYIVDNDNDRVIKRLLSDFSFVNKIGDSGSGDDQFSSAVAALAYGNYVYVADYGQDRISVRSAQADQLAFVKVPAAGGGSRSNTDTGMSFSESLVATRRFTKTISDTGFTFSESLVKAKRLSRSITDTGSTVTETLVDRRTRTITDTGFTFSETLSRRIARTLLDTGFTFSETLTGSRVKPRTITDTGFTFSETLVRTKRQLVELSDTGLSSSDQMRVGIRNRHFLFDSAFSNNVTLFTDDFNRTTSNELGGSWAVVDHGEEQATNGSSAVFSVNSSHVSTATAPLVGTLNREIEILTKFKATITDPSYIEVIVGPIDQYGQWIAFGVSYIDMYYDGGPVFNYIYETYQSPDAFLSDTWYWLKTKITSAKAPPFGELEPRYVRVLGKVWKDGDAEPSSFTDQYANSVVQTYRYPYAFGYVNDMDVLDQLGLVIYGESGNPLSFDSIVVTGSGITDSLVSSVRRNISLSDNGCVPFPAPSTAVLDTFSGTLSSWTNPAWSTADTFSISSGHIIGQVGLQCQMAWTAAFAAGNLEAYATFQNQIGNGTNPGLKLANALSSAHGYILKWENYQNYEIRKVTDDFSSTVIATGAFTQAAGDIICLQRIGTALNLWVYRSSTWSLIATVTDATYTDSTRVGIFDYDGFNTYDDFGGGVPAALVYDSLAINKIKGIALSDTGFSFSESLLTRRNRIFSDTGFTFSESLVKIKALTRAISDTGFTFSETLVDRRNRILTDTGNTFSESMVRRPTRVLTDQGMTQTDSLVKTATYARAITDQGATVTETLTTRRARLASDTGVTVSESLVRLLLASRPPNDQGVTQTDTLASRRTRPITDQGSTVSDSLVKLALLTRAITDTGMTLTDVLAERISHNLTDTGVTPSDSLVRQASRFRTISDTGATNTDSLATVRTHVLSDTGVTNTDSILTLRTHSLSDTGLTQTDSLDSFKTLGSTSYPRTATDTGVTNTDTLVTLRLHVLTDTGLTQTDSLTTLRVHVLSDTGATITETLTDVRVRNLTDTGVTQTDSLATVRRHFISDTGVTNTDTLITNRNRAKTDTGVTPSDSLARTIWLHFTITDQGVTQTDSPLSNRNRLKSDTGLTQTDSLARTISLHFTLTDTGVTQTDTQITNRNRVKSDTGCTITDSLVKLAQHFITLSDTGVSHTDVLGPRISHSMSDAGVTQTDTLVKSASKVITDTGVSQNDTLATKRSRFLSDTGCTNTDSLVKTQWLHFTLTDTGVTNTDAIATARVRTQTDTGVTQSDSLVKYARKFLTDTGLTQTDSVNVSSGLNINLSDNGVTFSESLVATRQFHLTASDTGVTSSDALSSNRNRSLTTTGCTHSDSLATRRVRVLSDTGMSLTDVLAERIYHYLTDTGVTPSDSLTRRLFATRPLTDTALTQTDSLVALHNHYITATDTGVTNTDSLLSRRTRVLSDIGLTQTDALSSSSGLNLNITDTGVSFSDSLASTRYLFRSLSDTLTQTDTLTSNRNHCLTDTGVVNSDSVSTVRRRYLVDTGMSLTDVLAERIYHYLTDTGVTPSDSLTRRLVVTRSISDTGLTQTDNLSTSTSGSIQISDTGVTQTDSLVATRRLSRTLSDTLTFSDTLISYRRVSITLTDTGISLTDVLAERIYHNRTDTGITQSDSLVATRWFHINLTTIGNSHTDVLGSTAGSAEYLTDTAVTHNDSLALRVGRYISDTLTFTDNIGPYREFHLTLSDTGLTQTDTLVAFRFNKAFHLVAGTMYRRYAATMDRHYEEPIVYAHWARMKLNVFKTFYVREWYRRWRS